MSMKSIALAGFTGGLNTRDAASELKEDEIPDALNVTLDERGAIQKRLGYQRRFSTAIAADRVVNLFDWATRGLVVSQIGAAMYVDNAAAAFHTWTTEDRCGMCEFNGNLVLVHPVDGVKNYDGTTVTGAFANAPLGNVCATWQNKVWFAGNPTNPSRITFTDAGTSNTFSVNSWVDLREKDSAKIICLSGASGLDISGRPGLLAFKQDSAYRIYDSATGAYNTIDSAIGCGSNIGAISAYGRTYTISTRGIYSTDGLSPMREESAKIENMFHSSMLNIARPDLFCAGRRQDRLYFSVPLVGETENTRELELHPLGKWIMAHERPVSCYASRSNSASELVFGSSTEDGLIFNSHSGGSDDGDNIACHFQTRWIEPNFGNLVRIRRIRFVGLGEFDAALYRDYEVGQSLPSLDVSLTSDEAEYDDPGAVYDDPDTLYGPTAFQIHQDFWSIGTCRSFSVRIEETSSLVTPGRDVLGQAQNDQGAWTLGHISLLVIDLGFH